MNHLGSRLCSILAVTILALFAVGCGDDDGADDESDPEPESATDDPTIGDSDRRVDDANTSGTDLLGTVAVDGVEYEITEVYNCEPLDDGTIERSLELQGLGEHDGERVQIDIVMQEIAGTAMNDVSWSGPEGVFGGFASSDVDGPATSDVALINDGAIVTGSATLVDALGQEKTVSVGFNLAVPDQTITCR